MCAEKRSGCMVATKEGGAMKLDDHAVLSEILAEIKVERKRLDVSAIKLRKLIGEFESELEALRPRGLGNEAR